MIVEIERARLSAIMRVLVDSGDMTPMAVRQINNVVDDENKKALVTDLNATERSLIAVEKSLIRTVDLLRLHWREHADISLAFHNSNNNLATTRQALHFLRQAKASPQGEEGDSDGSDPGNET